MARKRAKKTGQSQKPAVEKKTTPGAGWEQTLERYGFWVALAALLLFLVVFFNPIFFGGKTFMPADQVSSQAHLSYRTEAFESSGSLLERYPQWTPYIFSGMPFFASMSFATLTG